ncbi:hypothetical protein NDU88_002819 [Pleurodeles waltl]|uniref:Uncharacterized protein n=1 Tax=Pleurodeles waltl TaxID=8319 RepID=A0AAV7LDI9_PLEWA|nr:hypothetical protein NDU88_002819 [Pleurodeles waltl]
MFVLASRSHQGDNRGTKISTPLTQRQGQKTLLQTKLSQPLTYQLQSDPLQRGAFNDGAYSSLNEISPIEAQITRGHHEVLRPMEGRIPAPRGSQTPILPISTLGPTPLDIPSATHAYTPFEKLVRDFDGSGNAIPCTYHTLQHSTPIRKHTYQSTWQVTAQKNITPKQ